MRNTIDITRESLHECFWDVFTLKVPDSGALVLRVIIIGIDGIMDGFMVGRMCEIECEWAGNAVRRRDEHLNHYSTAGGPTFYLFIIKIVHRLYLRPSTDNLGRCSHSQQVRTVMME